MMDVVFSFGGEVENYNKSLDDGFDWMEAFIEDWTDDFDVCDFMKMIFDLMYYNYKHYIGVIEERAFKWLVDNEFIEKIDDEYNNHYQLYLW